MGEDFVYDYRREVENEPVLVEKPIRRQENQRGGQLYNPVGESKQSPWKQNFIWVGNIRCPLCPNAIIGTEKKVNRLFLDECKIQSGVIMFRRLPGYDDFRCIDLANG